MHISLSLALSLSPLSLVSIRECPSLKITLPAVSGRERKGERELRGRGDARQRERGLGTVPARANSLVLPLGSGGIAGKRWTR